MSIVDWRIIFPGVLLVLLLPGNVTGAEAIVAAGIARQGDAAMTGAGPDALVAGEYTYAQLHWPVLNDKRKAISVGFDYQYTHFNYTGLGSRDRDLHDFRFPLSMTFFAEDAQVATYLAPGIATSSNVLNEFSDRSSSDDWYVNGAIEARFGAHRRQWLVGAAYDRSFGEDRFYPVVGLRLSPSDEVDIRVAYPVAGIAWRLSDRDTFTARILPAGFTWHVVIDDLSADFDYRVEGIRSQLYWSRNIFKRVFVNVSASYESDRYHELYDDLGNRITATPASEWLFSLSFGIGGAPPIAPHDSRVQTITQ